MHAHNAPAIDPAEMAHAEARWAHFVVFVKCAVLALTLLLVGMAVFLL